MSYYPRPVRCPACQEPVEDGAEMCLSCGEPITAQRSPRPIAATVAPPIPSARPGPPVRRTARRDDDTDAPRCPGCGTKNPLDRDRCRGCGSPTKHA